MKLARFMAFLVALLMSALAAPAVFGGGGNGAFGGGRSLHSRAQSAAAGTCPDGQYWIQCGDGPILCCSGSFDYCQGYCDGMCGPCTYYPGEE